MIVFLVLVLWPPSDLANKCQRDSFLSSSSSLLTLPANKDPAFRRNKFPGGNFSQISGWTISLIPAYRQPPLSTPLIPFQRKQSASRSYLTSLRLYLWKSDQSKGIFSQSGKMFFFRRREIVNLSHIFFSVEKIT